MHYEGLTAAGGVLKAKLVQIIFTVEWHINFIGPVVVETFNEYIELVLQIFAIAEKLFQIESLRTTA